MALFFSAGTRTSVICRVGCLLGSNGFGVHFFFWTGSSDSPCSLESPPFSLLCASRRLAAAFLASSASTWVSSAAALALWASYTALSALFWASVFAIHAVIPDEAGFPPPPLRFFICGRETWMLRMRCLRTCRLATSRLTFAVKASRLPSNDHNLVAPAH